MFSLDYESTHIVMTVHLSTVQDRDQQRGGGLPVRLPHPRPRAGGQTAHLAAGIAGHTNCHFYTFLLNTKIKSIQS